MISRAISRRLLNHAENLHQNPRNPVSDTTEGRKAMWSSKPLARPRSRAGLGAPVPDEAGSCVALRRSWFAVDPVRPAAPVRRAWRRSRQRSRCHRVFENHGDEAGTLRRCAGLRKAPKGRSSSAPDFELHTSRTPDRRTTASALPGSTRRSRNPGPRRRRSAIAAVHANGSGHRASYLPVMLPAGPGPGCRVLRAWLPTLQTRGHRKNS